MPDPAPSRAREELEALLPKTFHAGKSFEERLTLMVQQWQKATTYANSLMRCYDCDGLFPLANLFPASAHPDADPLCSRCLKEASLPGSDHK